MISGTFGCGCSVQAWGHGRNLGSVCEEVTARKCSVLRGTKLGPNTNPMEYATTMRRFLDAAADAVAVGYALAASRGIGPWARRFPRRGA